MKFMGDKGNTCNRYIIQTEQKGLKAPPRAFKHHWPFLLYTGDFPWVFQVHVFACVLSPFEKETLDQHIQFWSWFLRSI